MFKYAILFFFLFSCSANYHLNKAIKKGAELETIEVKRVDTVWHSSHYYELDTIYDHNTIVKYIPKTKWETRIEYRYDYKRFKDSLKHYRRIYSDSLRNALKTSKIENKTERKKNNRVNRFLWWAMTFFIILLIIVILARKLADKLLN